ncbi:MAG: sister chromatid cohesion protein PDS5 [Pyrinomonadaceae bacterium]
MTINSTQDSVGVFTTDTNLIIQVWDAALARLTGISTETASGQQLVKLIPDVEARRLLARFRRVLEEGMVEVLAPAFHHYLIACAPLTPSKRFERMQQRVNIAPLREGERIAGLIVTVEDVTERLDRERDLAEHLAHEDEATRLRAAQTLAGDESLDGAPPLLGALKDESWRVRRAAVEGVARRAAPDAIAALLNSVRENHHNLSLLNSALQVLALSDVDTLSPLVEFLKGPDIDLRMQAALALGEQRDSRATPALLSALEDADANVRYHVIEALGKLRAIEAADALAAIAETRDFFLSFPALDALTQIGDARVAPRLVPLLEDEFLREPAAGALSKLGDEAMVAPLAALLNTPHAPTLVIAESLAVLHDRFEKLYGEGEHIADLSRRAIDATGARNLLDALDEQAAENLRPLALVLGWLEGAAVEHALTHLLGRADARNEIVEALVRHGSGVTDSLIEQLESEDLEIRRSAVVALGRIGDARATPALVRVLEEDSELIIPAAGALAKIGDRRAFDALLGLIGDADAAVRQAVVGALNSLGAPEMPARIIPLLVDEDPNVRESAVRIAGYFGYAECADLLLERCLDRDERVRRAAIEHLPYLEDERVIGVLTRALEHGTPKVRASAASALAHVEEAESVSHLVSALKDEDAWVRYFAARSLGQRGARESIDALAGVAQSDKLNHVRIAALEALGRIGGERAAAIAAPFVESEDSDLGRAALIALGNIAHPGALAPLVNALRSTDAGLRAGAATALGERGGAEALEQLQRLAATDAEPAVVEAAIVALKKLATSEAVASLVALTSDATRREAASAALAEVPDARIEDVARGLSHHSAEVRRTVVEVLARMKRPRASELLRVALDDADASVRLAAADALGKSYQPSKAKADER